jgi:hypothetical protein
MAGLDRSPCMANFSPRSQLLRMTSDVRVCVYEKGLHLLARKANIYFFSRHAVWPSKQLGLTSSLRPTIKLRLVPVALAGAAWVLPSAVIFRAGTTPKLLEARCGIIAASHRSGTSRPSDGPTIFRGVAELVMVHGGFNVATHLRFIKCRYQYVSLSRASLHGTQLDDRNYSTLDVGSSLSTT